MAAAGWYPDPYERAEVRWFDGDRWTTSVASYGQPLNAVAEPLRPAAAPQRTPQLPPPPLASARPQSPLKPLAGLTSQPKHPTSEATPPLPPSPAAAAAPSPRPAAVTPLPAVRGSGKGPLIGLVVILIAACAALGVALVRRSDRTASDAAAPAVTGQSVSSPPSTVAPVSPPATAPPITTAPCPGEALNRYLSELAPDVNAAYDIAVSVLDEAIAMVPENAPASELLTRNGFLDQRKALADGPVGPPWALICNKGGLRLANVCVTVLGPYFDTIVRPRVRDAPLRIEADPVITISDGELNRIFALERENRLVRTAVGPYDAAVQGMNTCLAG